MATLSGLSLPISLEDNVSPGLRRTQRNIDNSARQIQRSTGQIRQGFSQAGFQVSDFFVQIQSGTPVIRAFVQQGSQLAAAFGPIGIAIGTAGTVIGVAAGALLGMSEQASAASKTAKALESSQKLLTEAISDTDREANKLIKTYRSMSAEMLTIERINLASALREQEQVIRSVREQAREAAEDFMQMGQLRERAQIGADPIAQRLIDLIERFRTGEIDLRRFQARVTELNTAMTEHLGRGLFDLEGELGDFDTALREGVQSLSDAEDAAARTRVRMQLLADVQAGVARTSDDVAKGGENVRKVMDAQALAVRRFTAQLRKASEERREFVRQREKDAEEAQRIADEAARMADIQAQQDAARRAAIMTEPIRTSADGISNPDAGRLFDEVLGR